MLHRVASEPELGVRSRKRGLVEKGYSAIGCQIASTDHRDLTEDSSAGVAGRRPKFRFDAHQLIVFGGAVAAGQAAGLDLPAVGSDGEIGDGGVFGLAGAVADDGAPAGAMRDFDRFKRLGQGADLVELDQYRIGRASLNAAAQAFGVGDEDVVAESSSLLPSVAVRCFQPSQSSSAQPSSMATTG